MNFCHSFWSKPLFDKKFGDFNNCLYNILLDYAYSVACIHKRGHTITLYADSKGIDLLSFIPYDNIVKIDIESDESKHFAAQIKFKALERMSSQDVLIDGDIFIETSDIFDLIKVNEPDLMYSFDESNETVFMKSNYDNIRSYYDKLLSKFNSVDNLHFEVPTIDQLRYPNTSLLKIPNQELKSDYIKQYFYHKNLLKDIDFENTWPDLLIEQYFIWNYEKDWTIKPLMNKYVNSPGYIHLGNAKDIMQSKIRQKLYFLDKDLMKSTIKKYREMIID